MKNKKKNKFERFFDNLNQNLSDLGSIDRLIPLTDDLINELVNEVMQKHRKNLVFARSKGAYFNTLTRELVFPFEVLNV